MKSEKISFEGRIIERVTEQIPAGPMRMNAISDAVRQADEAGDVFWRLRFRYNLAGEATFRDDPPKAMAPAAEFAAIFEEDDQGAVLGEVGPSMYLMITEMEVDPMVHLPEISQAQWERTMKHFRKLVDRYQLGLRTWYWQNARFLAAIDLARAKENFELFLSTPRDEQSDCEACEHSEAVWFCLFAGDKKRADALAVPILNGSLTCGDVPQSTWQAYLDYYMDQGDLTLALPMADALAEKGQRGRSDLSFVGSILRCWAFAKPEEAVKLLEHWLPDALSIWDWSKRYDFYKGAWVCCRQLAKQGPTAALQLPASFEECRQEEGVYRTEELADWFHGQAARIAERFDARNGTAWYTEHLQLAEQDL